MAGLLFLGLRWNTEKGSPRLGYDRAVVENHIVRENTHLGAALLALLPSERHHSFAGRRIGVIADRDVVLPIRPRQILRSLCNERITADFRRLLASHQTQRRTDHRYRYEFSWQHFKTQHP